jgi:uncharacterized protein (TIGR00251 family)
MTGTARSIKLPPDDLISIRVVPKASRSEVKLTSDRSVRVYVTAVPADGAANKAVIALLAMQLKIAKSKIEIVRGHSNRDKQIRIEGLDQQGLIERLS